MKRAPIRSDLTAEYVRSLLGYDPQSGIFVWKVTRARTAKAGMRAGRARKDKYREITVAGHGYLEHRLAWLVTYDEWPRLDVDHVDGDKSNNAACNLRHASRSDNCKNAIRRGCYFRKDNGKYAAAIQVDGKRLHLGLFQTEELARAAYLSASEKHFGEFSVVNRPVAA